MANVLGIVAGILTLGGIIEWSRRIIATRVPEDRTGFVVAMSMALALGSAGLLAGAEGLARAGAWTGAITGGLFVALVAFSKQDDKIPAVTIGGPVLDFSAIDHEGNPFALSSLQGRPFLLKFFRGHW